MISEESRIQAAMVLISYGGRYIEVVGLVTVVVGLLRSSSILMSSLATGLLSRIIGRVLMGSGLRNTN